MNYSRVIPLLLAFGSVAFSQGTGKRFSSETTQAACPVELTATLWSAGTTVPLAPIKDAATKERDLWLQITLSNPQSEIASAKITIHGFPVGGRVRPAVLYSPDDPYEIRKVVDFDSTVALKQAASTYASVKDFSTVTSIELNEITYSDGSGWRPANKSCRAIGSPSNAVVVTQSR